MTVLKKELMIVGIVLVSMLPFVACASHHYNSDSHHYNSNSPRRVVYVEVPPPMPVVEVVTVSPGAGYVWIPGHHRWDGNRYVWVVGSWRVAPQGRTLWIAGRWEQSPRGWYWVGGRWS
jgi:hypothetical protein